MNMQVFDDKHAIEREYTMILLREFLQRVFKVLNRGDLWKEFLEHARSSQRYGQENNPQLAQADKLIASSIFKSGWRLIAYSLYQCRAPVDINDDLIVVLNEFFTDPDNSQITYGQIAIDVIWDDQSDLESFRHLKHSLETSEEIGDCQLTSDLPEDEVKKIEREDLLRSLIKLAMLPSRRFPESVEFRDRQRWVFAEDLNRLIKKYLPESGIQTDIDELRDLILQIMPRFKNKPHLLQLIKDYEYDLIGEVLDLTELIEETVPEPIKEVLVSIVVIDGKTHLNGVGKQAIEFSSLGILKALAALTFEATETDDFKQEVSGLLYKIMEILRGPDDKKFNTALGLLGDFRAYLYEIKKKLSKFHGVDISTLKPAELKQRCILDSLGPIEADISEIMPMSLTSKATAGMRILDPKVTG
jgi:hypothetical protein